jgi:hypothetical protein
LGFSSATDEAALAGKIEGKKLFEKPGRRWEESSKFDLVLIGRKNVDLMCCLGMANSCSFCGQQNEISSFLWTAE